MKINDTIKLKGISKRGKQRITTHGNTFKLIHKSKGIQVLGENPDAEMICVESLNNTWHGQRWMGWFEIGSKGVEIINNSLVLIYVGVCSFLSGL